MRPFFSSKRVYAILGLTLCFIGLALAFIYLGRDKSAPLLMSVIGLFAFLGVWASFLMLAGVLHFNKITRLPTHSFLQAMPQLMLVSDSNGAVIEKSAGFTRVFGETTTHLQTLLHSHNDAYFRLLQGAAKGIETRENFLILGLNYKVSATRLDNQSGQFIVALEDKSLESGENERLYAMVQRTMGYIDHAPAGFFVCDKAGRVSFINEKLALWLGKDLADLDLNSLQLKAILPLPLQAIFLSGLPQPSQSDVFEGAIQTMQGDKNVKILRQTMMVDGQPLTYCLAIELFSPRSRPEQSLHLVQSRLSHYFEHSPLGMMVLNKEGQVRRANPVMAQLQSALKTPQATNIAQFVTEPARVELEQALQTAQQQGAKTQSFEFPLATQAGGWGRFYLTPLPQEEDEGDAILVYLVDTSEQRSLLDQFAQSQKMQAIGQLAGGVAHDFNNVLQAIIGNCELLLMNMRTTDPAFAEVRDIKSNANRAAALVRQLLAFSRKQTFRLSTLHVNDVISDMSPLLKRSISEKMTLDINYGRDLWHVKSDLTQIEQVLLNLVVNARDAMVKGGKLIIKTENIAAPFVDRIKHPEMPLQDYIRIDVQDEGTGIPPEIMKKIFEPFFTTKDLNKGTGLGLSTVYGIVKQTGGFIYVDSVMGQGTTFSLYLPRFIEEVKEVVVTKASTAPPTPPKDMTGNGKILLVEDELAVRAFGQRALTARGYTVLPAESGVEALEIFEEENGEIDLVISDVVMPEMDGPSLLRELRARNPNVRFIFVSGYAEEAFAKNLPADQEFHFLAKPFQMAELIAKVKEAMG